MFRMIQGLVRAYESLVPPSEPLCRHGFGVWLCDVCPEPPARLLSGDRWSKLEVGRPAPPVRRGYQSTGATACSHRPGGQAEASRCEAVGEPNPGACSCCGGPVSSGPGAALLCPVCRLGRPHLGGGGHLVRLALDLGARPAGKTFGTELREVEDSRVGNLPVLAGTAGR